MQANLNSISDNLIFYKGALISFNNSPLFFDDQEIGIIFWNNGTSNQIIQYGATYDKNEANPKKYLSSC